MKHLILFFSVAVALHTAPSITTQSPPSASSVSPVVANDGSVQFGGQIGLAAAAVVAVVPAVSYGGNPVTSTTTTQIPYMSSTIVLNFTPPSFQSNLLKINTTIDISRQLGTIQGLPILRQYISQ